MSFFQRITATISSRVDRLVGELENQDAVVEASLRESRRAYARAQVRHRHLLQAGERLEQRIQQLRQEARRWRERARSTEDEETALACLRRAKAATRQGDTLEPTLRHHRELEARLGGEIQAIQERMAILEHRRQGLRSREAVAQAAAQIRRFEEETHPDLEEVFERWETRVLETELAGGESPVAPDPLEAEFRAREEREALREELAALRRESEDRHEQP